jgi:tRNA G18 (ribose-2'-O)-methylase SpoU
MALGPLIVVDSPDDARLECYRGLNDPDRRTRIEAERSVFMVEGKLAVARLLTSDYRICSLLVDDHSVHSAGDLVAATRSRGAAVFVGSRAMVADTVGFDLHRGVVAVASRPSSTDPGQVLVDAVAKTGAGEGVAMVAVLEGLNDHENIGGLFRNAAAFGVGGMLLDPRCADPLYRRSVRVSVGHVLHVPFARLATWPAGLDRVRAAGFVIAALSPRPVEPGGTPAVGLAALRARLSGPGRPAGVALLLGAEGPGLSDGALAASDVVVSIPMASGVDSLNVATAGAVAFHALIGR